MPKYLLIIANACPGNTSHSHRLAEASKEVLTAAGNEVKIVDLIKVGFGVTASQDDFLDKGGDPFDYAAAQTPSNLCEAIIEQQKLIEWCTHIIVFAPVWYYRIPSCFQAWQERVWTKGWAYSKPVETLGTYGKKAMFVLTAGAGESYYTHGNSLTSIDGLMYFYTFSMARCGMTVYETQLLGNVSYKNEETFAHQLELWKKAVLKMEKRKILPHDKVVEGKDNVQIFAEFPVFPLEQAAEL
ncbi:Flavodoxin-like fold family protein [Histomonas meleagridis]|uniref:Flavodoxin-like fold family protein n=1 Tax=Histomonas meleagridis TaxID=135588 RepID=UPI0035597D4F|nr:Flavodoxin-like fold family protein [Histomonas meleagridis]KAH0796455.1 Flavodoxin-like fold family protein [Histomonas meleagridis]